MKGILLFTGLWIGSVSFLLAQVPKKYRIRAGEVVVNVIPENERYSYGHFKEGKILFANGKISTAKLNYNLLYGEMEFIDEQGDTLSLANEPLVQNILIGDDLFYSDFNNLYLEVISDFPSLKLAAKERLIMIRKEEEDFVNPENDHFRKLSDDEFSKKYFPTASPVTYRQFYTNPVKEELLLVKVVTYHFIDYNNHFHPARKSKVWKIFPGNKRAIKEFLKENNINFYKKEDLVKLVEFCDQLNYP